MPIRYYSVPRVERSSSLDRGVRATTMARDLYDDYDLVKNRSRRNDMVMMNRYGRAMSVLDSGYAPPVHQVVRRRNLNQSNYMDGPLATSNLRASPPYYFDRTVHPLQRASSVDYLNYGVPEPLVAPVVSAPSTYYRSFEPVHEYTIPRNYYYNDYRPFRPNYYPTYNYSHLPSANYYQPRSYNRSLAQTYYPLHRYPSVPHYYRYNVLPFFGHNANDYRRGYRRSIAYRTPQTERFVAPPPRFYSTLRSDLRGILDKMDSHRTLIDRYSTIDMAPRAKSVAESIAEKSTQHLSTRFR